MELRNAIVKVIYANGRPRVVPEGFESRGFVRFPKHLRDLGARYRVALLREGKSGSWIAMGNITKVA